MYMLVWKCHCCSFNMSVSEERGSSSILEVSGKQYLFSYLCKRSVTVNYFYKMCAFSDLRLHVDALFLFAIYQMNDY